MNNTAKTKQLSKRDIYYYRRRFQNHIYYDLFKRYVELAKKKGLTKKEIAVALNVNPSVITRCLSEPSNMTLNTISDLLLVMGSELAHHVMPLDEEERTHYSPPASNNVVQFNPEYFRRQEPETTVLNYHVN